MILFLRFKADGFSQGAEWEVGWANMALRWAAFWKNLNEAERFVCIFKDHLGK